MTAKVGRSALDATVTNRSRNTQTSKQVQKSTHFPWRAAAAAVAAASVGFFTREGEGRERVRVQAVRDTVVNVGREIIRSV